MKDELRKIAHLLLWSLVGLGLFALIDCGLGQRSTEDAIRRFTEAAQTGAAVTGQGWAVPLIGAAGTAVGAIYHAVYGVPGVPAVTERVKRKRAVRKAQKEAASRSPGAP